MAGEQGGLRARLLFQAFGLAFAYKFLMAGLKAWKEVPGRAIPGYTGGSIATEVSPELIGGVGYIIGLPSPVSLRRGHSGVPGVDSRNHALRKRAHLADLPGDDAHLRDEAEPGPGELRLLHRRWRRGIGRDHRADPACPQLRSPSARARTSAARSVRPARGSGPTTTCPSEHGGRLAVLAFIISFLPQVGVNLLGAALIVVFGFFFVTVSAHITGEIGVSANPSPA